ncbi:hypothetical protein KJ909_00415 [Patescibacteria group bacterium]|nr:hypothetical protein [Patescibacteria group bacterium]
MKIEAAIEKTLTYANKFGMELNEEQIEERLLGEKIFKKKEIGEALRKMGLSLTKKKNLVTRKKMKLAQKMARMVAENDSDILFLGVSGSVAAENAKKKDDIDILVICRKNRLWWSRLKLKLFLKKNKIKHRSYGKKERSNDFCFNLWLEEDSLEIPKNKKNAIDLILLKILINKEKIYEKFLKKNSWAKKWVASGYEKKLNKKEKKNKNEEKENLKKDCLNILAFGLQYIYMAKRIREEKVGLKKAFFHKAR